jgi:hypothetical protein
VEEIIYGSYTKNNDACSINITFICEKKGLVTTTSIVEGQK